MCWSGKSKQKLFLCYNFKIDLKREGHVLEVLSNRRQTVKRLTTPGRDNSWYRFSFVFKQETADQLEEILSK